MKSDTQIKVFEKRRKKEFTARICRCLHTKGTHKEGFLGSVGKCYECICNKFSFLGEFTIIELEELQRANFNQKEPTEFHAYVEGREVQPLPEGRKVSKHEQWMYKPNTNLGKIPSWQPQTNVKGQAKSHLDKFYGGITIDRQGPKEKQTRRCLKCDIDIPNINPALEGHLLSKKHLENSK